MSVRQENRWRKHIKEENDNKDMIRLGIESLQIVRLPRNPATPPKDNKPSKAKVRRYMSYNYLDYDGPTQLVESANVEFDNIDSWLDDPGHWIWDIAASFYIED